MKKFALIFILIFSLSFLCGCNNQSQKAQISSNYIMLSISQNADGSSTQSVIFSVNSDFLRKNTNNLQEEFVFKQNLINQVENIRKEFLFSFALTYMANPNEEYKINKGVLLSQVGYNAENDYVGFEIIFTSLGAWQYYHTSSSESQTQKDKNANNGNIFYSKVKSSGIFPFSSILNDNLKVGERYKNCYINASKGLLFENAITKDYNPNYVYNYSTYYSRFHSNADMQFKGSDNKYHHVWIEDDLNESKEVILSVITIKKGWWIFFALLISLVGMTIVIIHVKFIGKKK